MRNTPLKLESSGYPYYSDKNGCRFVPGSIYHMLASTTASYLGSHAGVKRSDRDEVAHNIIYRLALRVLRDLHEVDALDPYPLQDDKLACLREEIGHAQWKYFLGRKLYWGGVTPPENDESLELFLQPDLAHIHESNMPKQVYESLAHIYHNSLPCHANPVRLPESYTSQKARALRKQMQLVREAAKPTLTREHRA